MDFFDGRAEEDGNRRHHSAASQDSDLLRRPPDSKFSVQHIVEDENESEDEY